MIGLLFFMLILSLYIGNIMLHLTKKQILFLMISLSFLLLASCGDNNDNPNNPGTGEQTGLYFNIKSATVVYAATSYSDFTGDMKISFDNYGKKFRYETSESIFIFDEDAKTSYILMPDMKTYMESPTDISSIRHAFMYLGDATENVWQHYDNYKKETDRTIAGKNCSVFSWNDSGEDFMWGGWNTITFIYSTTINGTTEQFEAKSIAESANANDFIVPADYTLITYGG